MPATMTVESEESLLARARSTSATEREVGFEALYRAYERPVLKLCWHLTGSRAEAEDALQETFLAVYRALPEFRGEARLGTWIHRIAVRVALRLRARRPSPPTDAPPAPARLDETVMAREESARLLQAMQRLSADHRTVLSLFALDGLGHQEIADILGVPEGTIWSRLHLARKRLAQLLEEKPASA